MRTLLVIFALAVSATATAQISTDTNRPSADEMRRDLFGVHLFGTVYGDVPWNECIEPDGDTLYTFQEVQRRGKAWVPQDGEICFNYGGSDNCFQAFKQGDEYVFHTQGSTWRTTAVRRDVEYCLISDMIG